MTEGRVASALVVGAGVAGLACAGALAAAGVRVTVLDKGRRPGGRVATRRLDGATVNHGAQFAAARGPAFATLLARLETEGVAAPWDAAGGGGRRMTFVPGMSALPGAMAAEAAAAGATLAMGRQAVFLHRSPAGWVARHLASEETRPGATLDAGGALSGPHDALVLALPPQQAAALLRTIADPVARAVAAGFDAAMAPVVMAPCWAVILRFVAPVPGPDVVQAGDGPLAWAAREGSRPGRPGDDECWTVHAGPGWSRDHLEQPAEAVAEAVVAAFCAQTSTPLPVARHAHRWRYALVETPAGRPCVWDTGIALGLCGDWCLGGRVEAAFDSGMAMARAGQSAAS